MPCFEHIILFGTPHFTLFVPQTRLARARNEACHDSMGILRSGVILSISTADGGRRESAVARP